ncbi:MAG: MarR family EPS-associated transcriptional regulator, partial [Pseudomonadota bacterium]
MTDEIRYKLLSLIEENPNISQREMADEMGVSLGKVNYCVKALVDVGHIKLQNFARSEHKSGYAYFLTPRGVKEKLDVAVRFLSIKQKQYDIIRGEIEELQINIKRQA